MLYFAGVAREVALFMQANVVLVVVHEVKNLRAAVCVAMTAKLIAPQFSKREKGHYNNILIVSKIEH